MSTSFDLSQITLVKRELASLVEKGLNSITEQDQVQNSIELYTFINNNFKIISHPVFNSTTNLLDTMILKMRDFRKSIIKKMDINYGFGIYKENYKILMETLDTFENKLIEIEIFVEPIENFDINEVITEIIRINMHNAPLPHVEINNPFRL
jgi:hypothetical protein